MKNIFKKEDIREEKPIAENPQYEAEEQKDEEERKSLFARLGEFFRNNRKKATVIAILAVFGVGAACYGGYVAIAPDAAKNTAKGEDTVTIIDEDGEKKEVEADSEEAKEAEEEGAVVTETKSDSTTKSNQEKSTAGNKGTTSKGSSGSSGSSSSTVSKPSHTHSWTATYGTRTVTKYRVETIEIRICSVCGSENPDTAHNKAHALAGEGGGWYSSTKTRQVPYTATESYVTGYKCSCGATK